MEYISREAVNDLIEDIRNNHFILMSDRVTLLLLKSKVAEIPTADVQSVKRGRWIKAQDKQGSYFLCSNCGTAEKTESDQDGTVWQHDEYCRKCGARMDGEQNE